MPAIILALLALVVGGASYYTTDVRQAEKADKLRDSRRVAELATLRVDELLVLEASSAEDAEAALSRWHSRYKYIPRTMDTADIVEYLESLTRQGFSAFDLKLGGRIVTPDYSTYTFNVEGQGDYEALYHLIWHLENNREFYRVHDLKMSYVDATEGTEQRPVSRDQVSFSFRIESFFAGSVGISAPEEDLVPVPVGLLLPHNTSSDIFAPMVRVPKNAPSTSVAAPASSETGAGRVAQAPLPNPEVGAAPGRTPAAQAAAQAGEARPDGLDVERSTLTLILGGQARFTDDWEREFTVKVGDKVEGGEIVAIDARRATVQARVGPAGRQRLVERTLGDRDANR